MTSLYANLDKARPYVLSIIRIIVALLFMEHGLQKFFAFPSAGPADMTPLLYIQGVIEIVGGILILIGLFTRPVAFFMAHFPRSFFPAANFGDSAVLYCFIFLYMVFAGPGRWSVDHATGMEK